MAGAVSSIKADGTVSESRPVNHGAPVAVTAAGTVIGNAASITGRFSQATGDDTVGVILPVASPGDEYLVYNLAATAGLKIYPQVNSSINGGTANASVTIEGKTLAKFVKQSATNWAAIYTANS